MSISQNVTRLFKLLNDPGLEALVVHNEVTGEVRLEAQGPGLLDIVRVVLDNNVTVDLAQYADIDWWRTSSSLQNAVQQGWLSLPADQSSGSQQQVVEAETVEEGVHYLVLLKPVDPAAASLSPSGHARMFFNASTNKWQVSENEGAFVNVIGPTGVTTLSYAASVALDFSVDLPTYRSIALTGNITLTTSNLGAGRRLEVRLAADGSSRTLTFPGTWKFIGSAVPASLDANKTAVLSLVSWGTTDANVTAIYHVEP